MKFSLSKLLRWFAVSSIILLLGSAGYTIYQIVKATEKIQQQAAGFIQVSKDDFNFELYQKAFKIDNKLIEYIYSKYFLINCDSCKKYLNIERVKSINNRYIVDLINQINNYSQEQYTRLISCNNWFWDIKTSNGQKKGRGKKKKRGKNNKQQKIEAKFTDCINYLEDYKIKNSNVSKPLVSYLDIKTFNYWNNLDKQQRDIILGTYTKYCNNLPMGLRELDKSRNIKLQNILCKNILNSQTQNIDIGRLNLENLQQIRQLALFLKLFDQENKIASSFKKIDIYLNPYLASLDKYDKVNKGLVKNIRKKIIFINCFDGNFNPNIITATDLTGDKANINILKSYSANNMQEYICILTRFNKQDLSFKKNFISILTDRKINKNKVVFDNHIYEGILNLGPSNNE